jgi:flagellin
MGVPSITNTQTAAIQFSISSTLDTQKSIAEQLATGQRIIQPFMDPAGLAIGTSLAVSLSDLQEALKTANQAEVVINIAYGGVKSITDLLKRLENLSFMALNGSASKKDKALVDKEAQQLKQEIDRIASSTSFNGKQLINGDRDQTSMVVKSDSIIAGTKLDSNTGVLSSTGAGTPTLTKNVQGNPASGNTLATPSTVALDASVLASTAKVEAGKYVFVDTTVYKNTGTTEIDGSSNKITGSEEGLVKQFIFEGTNTDIKAIKTADGQPAYTTEVTGSPGTSSEAKLVVADGAKPAESTLNFSQYNGSIMDELNTVNIINFDSKASTFKLNLADDEKTIMNLAGKPSGYTYDATNKVVKKDGVGQFKVDDKNNVKFITAPDETGSVSKTNAKYTITGSGIKTTEATKISTRSYKANDMVYDYNKPDDFANPMVYQVGDEPNQQVAFAFSALSTKVLGVEDVDFTQGDMKSKEYAVHINKALTQITEYAAQVGAYQSRFNFIAENLSLSIENVDAARAQFLDVDFTNATKNFTQNTAKLQASVTAQAKLIQTPQILNQLLSSM